MKRASSHYSSVECRVVLTLWYSAQFGVALATLEVWRRLVGARVSPRRFVDNLVELQAKGIIEYRDGLWWLEPTHLERLDHLAESAASGFLSTAETNGGKSTKLDQQSTRRLARELNSRVGRLWRQIRRGRPNQSTEMISAAKRHRRAEWSRQKIAEAEPLFQLCRKLPWVRGVAVTGSAAVGNARENDDLDLYIVCGPRRLWLARPILVLFSQLHGKRRTWRKEEPNSWCFNLWSEATTLAVPQANRSLYTAYEVCQVTWIVAKDNVDLDFLDENSWAYPLLFRYWITNIARSTARFSSIPNANVFSAVLDLANVVLYFLQRLYMKPHQTNETVTDAYAAFHPNILVKM